MTAESPGSTFSGHFACTQWQLPFASVMTRGTLPAFENLKSWVTFVFPSATPTSILSLANLISAKLFFGVSFFAEPASPQLKFDDKVSRTKYRLILFIIWN